MQKILVVDNSALMRRSLCDIINTDSDFHVIDMSLNGEDAYNKIMRNSYDIVVMEMVLPKMDGLAVLEKLKANKNKTKIIVMSTSIDEETDDTVRALELGAYDFVVRPAKINGLSEAFVRHLFEAMRNAANDVPLTERKRQVADDKKSSTVNTAIENKVLPKVENCPPKKTEEEVVPVKAKSNTGKMSLIALACSTGGPQALHKFLPMLPASMNVPMVLVQHMPAGFTKALADRLDETCNVRVKEAEDKEVLQPGWVYIAPGGRHMTITENQNKQACVSINDDPPVNSLRPCADVMYQSLCKLSLDNILCVVLTGMGADGTQGISELQKHKHLYVISESQETCTVYGMPKSIEKKGLANETVPIEKVSESIMKKLGD